MIIVFSGLRQKEIIELVTQIEVNSKHVFSYISKEGIQIRFNQEIDIDNTVDFIKKRIKDASFGRSLNFTVESK